MNMTSRHATQAGESSLDALTFLVRTYADLGHSQRITLLHAAIEAIAEQRGSVSDNQHETNWPRTIAEQTFPTDYGAASIRSRALDVDPDADEAFFPDGPVHALIESVFLGEEAGRRYIDAYKSIQDRCSAFSRPADADQIIGPIVSEIDFKTWDEDESCWVLNADAHRAEVERRCARSVADMYAAWRQRFFAALLA